jgi:carbonic anhydrase
MRDIPDLLEQNRQWAEAMTEADPAIFARLTEGQSPGYLWIGCSDSRVPTDMAVGALPGELFVHRNIANIVMASDPSGEAVVQYAVEALRVPNIIICGHYGCGGIRAAVQSTTVGPLDRWLDPIRTLNRVHADVLSRISDPGARLDRLCELNVRQQVINVCEMDVVQGAWRRGQALAVHGWIYDLRDGRLRDLGLSVEHAADLAKLTSPQ